MNFRKLRILSVVAFFIGGSHVYAEMHAFELQDGRALEAEVVDFNTKLGKVELERQDGKRVQVKPDVFIEADQKYITEWAMLNEFKNASTFKVECSKKKVEQWKEESSAFQTKFERYVYEVDLENRSAIGIDHLKAEYRIFYEQEENDRATKKVVTSKHTQPGSFKLERFGAKEKQALKTKPVVLKEFEFNISDFYVPGGDPESTNGEIKGMWLRLTVTMPSGLTAVRDIYEPQSIKGKYIW